jgi:arginine transport system substrate-binding protein
MFVFVKKYFIAILAIAMAFGFIVIKPFQSTGKPIHETLVIGLQNGYPPFEFVDTEGKIVGFDVDVAGRIAEKLEKTLVIKDMEFEGEILSLKQGKIDLIMSGMNITPSRLKEISMIPYHGEDATSLSLIFWNEIPEGVHSIEDIAKLPNPTVSVESGTIPELYLSRYKNIHAKPFQGALGSLMDVKYGKSVANLVEPDVAEYLKQQHAEIKIVSVPLSKEESILGFGIGVKKENQELFQQVQQIIQELKESGELKKIEDKWFKPNLPPTNGSDSSSFPLEKITANMTAYIGGKLSFKGVD